MFLKKNKLQKFNFNPCKPLASKKGQGAGPDGLSLFLVACTLLVFFIIIMVIIKLMGATKTNPNSSSNFFNSQNYNELTSSRYTNSFFNTKIDGGTMYDLLLKYYVNGDAESQDEFNEKANDLVQSTIGGGKCFTVFVNDKETFTCAGGMSLSGAVVDSEVIYPAYDGETLKLRLVIK